MSWPRLLAGGSCSPPAMRKSVTGPPRTQAGQPMRCAAVVSPSTRCGIGCIASAVQWCRQRQNSIVSGIESRRGVRDGSAEPSLGYTLSAVPALARIGIGREGVQAARCASVMPEDSAAAAAKRPDWRQSNVQVISAPREMPATLDPRRVGDATHHQPLD